MIQVMMTDDHLMVCEGIKALLEIDGDIKVIADYLCLCAFTRTGST